MSAAERMAGTVELLEMVLVSLPLTEMLLARRVSRTCKALVEQSARFNEIRKHPCITAKLSLPYECSISSSESPMLNVDLVLCFDRPITVRLAASPLAGPFSLTYRYELGTARPEPFPLHPVGAVRKNKLQLCPENESKYVTLLPGLPFRLTFEFGISRQKPGFEHLPLPNTGLNNLQVGKEYVLGVTPGRKLPVYVDTKHSLLDKVNAGIGIEALDNYQPREEVVLQSGVIRKMLPLVAEDEVHFQVVE